MKELEEVTFPKIVSAIKRGDFTYTSQKTMTVDLLDNVVANDYSRDGEEVKPTLIAVEVSWKPLLYETFGAERSGD